MSDNKPKILIISSDTGGGHRSAAAAIVAGIESIVKGDSYAIRVVRQSKNRITSRPKWSLFITGCLRNKQHWMKYLYWAVNRFRPETASSFSRDALALCASSLNAGALTSS